MLGLEVNNILGIMKFGRQMVLGRLQDVSHGLCPSFGIYLAVWKDLIWYQRNL